MMKEDLHGHIFQRTNIEVDEHAMNHIGILCFDHAFRRAKLVAKLLSYEKLIYINLTRLSTTIFTIFYIIYLLIEVHFLGNR